MGCWWVGFGYVVRVVINMFEAGMWMGVMSVSAVVGGLVLEMCGWWFIWGMRREGGEGRGGVVILGGRGYGLLWLDICELVIEALLTCS